MAAASPSGKPGRLLLLVDEATKEKFLVDTGSAFSILPYNSTEVATGPAIVAADRTPIKCWGRRTRTLVAAGYHFCWEFLLARVAFPILGADFLEHFDMWVDLKRRRLHRPGRRGISLHAPTGKWPAVSVGVVAARSTKDGQPPAASSKRGSQPSAATSTQGSQPPAATSTQGNQPPAATNTQGGQPPAASSKRSSQPPAATSTQGSQPPAASRKRSSQPTAATSTQGSKPPAAASTQGNQPPAATSTQGGQPPVATSTQDVQQRARQLAQEFPEVLNWPKQLKAAKHKVEHVIETTCTRPVTARYRRLDPEKLELAKREFSEMEKQGMIRRSKSSWASPLHMVPKADGTWRPCGDYRRLNLETKPDLYPPPHVEDLTARLAGMKIFRKLD